VQLLKSVEGLTNSKLYFDSCQTLFCLGKISEILILLWVKYPPVVSKSSPSLAP